MPRVMFWNIARSGGSMDPLSGTNLVEDLAGLGETYRPDVVILCECLAGFDDHSEQQPSGYGFVRPSGQGRYTGDTMLRYGVLARGGGSCRARLVPTASPAGRLRPAVVVESPAYRVIALHAASISASSRVQMDQLFFAYGQATRSGRGVDLLLGDFNIDFRADRSYVASRLKGTALVHFEPRASRENTHGPRTGPPDEPRDYVKILDWTLVSPSIARQVSIRAIQATHRTPEEKAKDRYLKLEFENRKDSDHRPIMAEW